MKFNRLELLTAVREGLEGQRAVHERRIVEYDAAIQQWVKNWHDEYDHQWLEFADRLKAIIERGEVVTAGNLDPHRGFSAKGGVKPPRVYHEPTSRDIGSRPSDEYREPKELRQIVDLLELAEDENISSNALKEMGYSTQSLRAAVDYVSQHREEMRRKQAEQAQKDAKS